MAMLAQKEFRKVYKGGQREEGSKGGETFNTGAWTWIGFMLENQECREMYFLSQPLQSACIGWVYMSSLGLEQA